MASIHVKNIPIAGRYDYSERILSDLKSLNDRVAAAKRLVSDGYVDAPYYPEMQSLGLDIGHDNGITNIYKINAPGYFFRLRYAGENGNSGVDDGFNPRGKTSILLASDPKYLVDGSKDSVDNRMLYMTCTDNLTLQGGVLSTSDQGNNMFQLPCGSSTYACFTRDPNMQESLRELFFVPTIFSASFGIKPDEYAVKVGETTTNNGDASSGVTIDGNILPADEDGKCSAIFAGDWTSNFRTMYGYHVANDDKLIFVSERDRTDFIRHRVNWLNRLGVTPSIYGYT